MKRYNNLHEKVCDIANIEKADTNARKNKSGNWGVVKHDRHKDRDNLNLQKQLQDLVYSTSDYSTFKIYEPKERIIFRLPYYPDRITHHAIMNITEPIWVKTFIANTYSCIRDRGIHKLAKDIQEDLREDPEGTVYCLKMDITKFYPSIDHDILKLVVRRKIKDKRLLVVLDEIIDSADGVPIGNYLSQFFANLYLTYFDHWIKEELKVKYYYRYADDIVILSGDKDFLHKVLILIKLYLKHNLKLSLKSNYQVFPVESRGVDFVGYKFYHTHTWLRKSIKLRLFKLIKQYKDKKIDKETLKKKLCSYFGWLKYCASKNLLRKILRETGIRYSNWHGEETIISRFYNKHVYIVEIVSYSKYFKIHLVHNGKSYSVKSSSKRLFFSIVRYNHFPLQFKLVPYVRSNKNRNKCKAEQN